MEVELQEIREFLAAHPPFDSLSKEALDRLPKALSVRYLRRGSPFPPTDTETACLYVIRSGAIELRNAQGELVGKYGEGEFYSALCVSDGLESDLDALTVEDSLFYLLPCDKVDALRRDHPQFAEHFSQSLRTRLRQALASLQTSPRDGLSTLEVRSLITRAPVCTTPQTTLGDAARLMTDERVSALLITEQQMLVGILTDRDLRTRCLAEGLSYDTLVSEVMTRKLAKVTPDSPAFEALLTMTRLGVHHLPVVERDGVVGVITSSDLIRQQSANALYLVGDLRRCTDVTGIVERAARLPELQMQLVAAGTTASQLGQAISSLTDAITERLLELAEAELGPPPLPYLWLAGGSQARREQTVHADQDNALILDDGYDEAKHGTYFAALARQVTEGLNACGFIYCPGEVMASNPQWRQPCRVWRRYFDHWITAPEPKALMLASNFFDLRPIRGELSLYEHLHAEVLKQTRANRIFIAHLAANALQNRPPLGFFRHFVLISNGEHARSFDLKHRGILPVVDLARVHALAAGLPEVNTVERLRAAAEYNEMSAEGASDLEDALEVIATVRVRHQAERIRHGNAPDNYVQPEELAPLERTHLKDAFAVIGTLQNALSQRYQSSRFY